MELVSLCKGRRGCNVVFHSAWGSGSSSGSCPVSHCNSSLTRDCRRIGELFVGPIEGLHSDVCKCLYQGIKKCVGKSEALSTGLCNAVRCISCSGYMLRNSYFHCKTPSRHSMSRLYKEPWGGETLYPYWDILLLFLWIAMCELRLSMPRLTRDIRVSLHNVRLGVLQNICKEEGCAAFSLLNGKILICRLGNWWCLRSK